VWYYLSERDSEIVRNPIDWVGLFFLSVGVGSLQIMLDNGHDLDWFDSNIIIALTLTSAISFLYFAIWNHFQKYPVVDFSFLRNKNFLLGTIAITVGYLLYFSSTVTIPLWLQTEQDYTPLWAGIAVAPVGIPAVLLSTTVGKYLNRVDLRYPAALSFVFFAIGFYYQSLFTTQVDLYHIMLARFLQGFGIVFFFLPLTQISMQDIPNNRLASASGLYHFIRILIGSGFGTSLAIQAWTHFEEFHHARLTENLTLYSPTTTQFYDELSTIPFSEQVINSLLDIQVEQQAFMLSTNDLSWMATWLFICMIPLVFLCKSTKPTSVGTIAAH
jgi:DHA2 family multidrug resistance protein